jgi:hypothetical protein
MNRICSNIEFGNYPVYIIPIEGDCAILCKGVKGLLSEMVSFLEKRNPTNYYPFGSRKFTMNHEGKVEVDCLSDSINKLEQIVNFCKNLSR